MFFTSFFLLFLCFFCSLSFSFLSLFVCIEVFSICLVVFYVVVFLLTGCPVYLDFTICIFVVSFMELLVFLVLFSSGSSLFLSYSFLH